MAQRDPEKEGIEVPLRNTRNKLFLEMVLSFTEFISAAILEEAKRPTHQRRRC